MIETYSKSKKTLLLLHSLKTKDIELTFETCVDILSLFKHSHILIQLRKKFQENKQAVDVDTDYLIEQKEKEIEELKKN